MRQANLLKNIEVLKEKKGIQFNTDLLYKIGIKMGKKPAEARGFVEKEKSNFSKMLKGERPLNYNYIIPLEEIFGVPFAKLQNPQQYFDLNKVNRDEIPFLKNFRYYAYKDEYDLYDELYSLTTNEGYQIIENTDEYNKSIFDYMIEYNSYNGLKYFVEKHNLRFTIYFTYDDHTIVLIGDGIYDQLSRFAKFIINSNDAQIFHKVFNSDLFLIQEGESAISIFKENTFIEAVLNNENIFNTLFKIKDYKFSDINRGVISKEKEIENITFVSPLLNLCLDFCLNNIETYKSQAKKIIEFGLEYNINSLQVVKDLIGQDSMSKLGNIEYRWVKYGNVIYTQIQSTNDQEINQLLTKLISQINKCLEKK